MLKIWNGAFWNEAPGVPVHAGDWRWKSMTGIVAGLTGVSLAIGLGAEGVMRLATRAAGQVLDQEGYAAAVLAHLGKLAGGMAP